MANRPSEMRHPCELQPRHGGLQGQSVARTVVDTPTLRPKGGHRPAQPGPHRVERRQGGVRRREARSRVTRNGARRHPRRNDDLRRPAHRVVPAGGKLAGNSLGGEIALEYLLDGGGGGALSSSSSSSSSSSLGIPMEQSEDEAKDEAWYKRMWLSNRDFLTYFSAAMDFEVPTEEPTPSGGGTRSGKREEGGARTGTSGGDSSWSTPCRATAMPSGILTTSRGGWGSLVRTIPWPDIPRAWTIHRSIKSNQMALAATCVPTPCYERLRYRR